MTLSVNNTPNSSSVLSITISHLLSTRFSTINCKKSTSFICYYIKKIISFNIKLLKDLLILI